MMERGKITCKFNHSTIQAEAGDVFLINSHDVHETRCTRNARYICIHILPSAMCRYVPNFDRLIFSLKFDPDEPVKSEALTKMRQYMLNVMDRRQKGTNVSNLEIHALLFGITAILVKNFSQPLTPEESKSRRSDMTRLEPLLEYTQLNHGEELTLDDAADLLGLNKAYFCRLFKKNMGVSYITYLNQIRAAAVCRELETSEDPIGEIGLRHGFTDSKMLNQYFRNLYGCTPSQKRKAFREMISDGIY